MNVKMMLIEKERVAYIQNNPQLAAFFAATLEYILGLEGEINKKDARIEDLESDKLTSR